MLRLLFLVFSSLALLSLAAQDVPNSAAEPQAAIVFSETTFDFGTVPQGEFVTHDFILTNDGTAPLIIEAVHSTCSCSTILRTRKRIKPGEKGTVSVFLRTEQQSGTIDLKYYLFINTQPAVQTLFLTGQVNASKEPAETPAPVVTFEQDLFDFGTVTEGELVMHDFTLTNTGNAPLLIDKITSTNEYASVLWPRSPIAPGQSVNITVFFSTANQSFRKRPFFTLYANTEANFHQFFLAGTIRPRTVENLPSPPWAVEPNEGAITAIQFSETSFDFGTIIEGDIVAHTFTFTNTGDAPLLIINAKGSCGCTIPSWPRALLAPGETAEMTVEFNSDKKRGRRNQKITVAANTDPSLTYIYLTGQVEPASARVTIPPLLSPDEAPTPAVLIVPEAASALPQTPTVTEQDPNCVTLFPNPTTDRLQLQIEAEQIGKPATIALYNYAGQLLNEGKWEAIDAVVSFDVSSYPAGHYVAQLKVGDLPPETQCFVVKK